MTVRQEAYKLIDSLPDASVSFLVQIIRNMSPEFYNGTVVTESSLSENDAIRKLQQISQLKDDWNGNGARAFPISHIRLVESLLIGMKYCPEVFPTACDTIQFEFDRSDGEHLEIEVPEIGASEYFYVDSDGNEIQGTVETTVEAMNELTRRFYESRL